MSPPLRGESDRQAIVGALSDGVIDAIATDHAPHELAAKEAGRVATTNEKEVNAINTGGTADSFRALTSNRVVATVLTPPFDDKAVSLGYKKFMQLGKGKKSEKPEWPPQSWYIGQNGHPQLFLGNEAEGRHCTRRRA